MFSKKNTKDQYFVEFEEILNDVELSKRTCEEDEDKMRSEVSGSVLKNNGWTAKVSGLLDIPANL